MTITEKYSVIMAVFFNKILKNTNKKDKIHIGGIYE